MLTLVTAGDEKYNKCLHQFLRTAQRHGLHRTHRFLVFDLGLKPKSRKGLEERFTWCEFRDFRFECYPSHVNLRHRTYAWKPQIVVSVADEFGGQVMWLDSATIFKGSLDPMIKIMQELGVISLAGQASIAERCEPEVLDALSVPPEVRHRPERYAGLVGFELGSSIARTILLDWSRFALERELIKPSRRTIERHTTDQAILGALLLRSEFQGQLVLTHHEVDISSANPVPWLTTRNKVNANFPRWALFISELYYDIYKFFDQRYLKYCTLNRNMHNTQPKSDNNKG